jgi:uncharacterized membrane protein YdjX (TVP38/TMEM64 family)
MVRFWACPWMRFLWAMFTTIAHGFSSTCCWPRRDRRWGVLLSIASGMRGARCCCGNGFEKIHASFERHEFWALMFPAMLPPPAPFKIVVLAAAAFEMNFGHFLLAIFAGRCVRFLIEALLTLWFGPEIVTLTGNAFAHHFVGILVGVGALFVVWLLWRRSRRTDQEVTTASPSP